MKNNDKFNGNDLRKNDFYAHDTQAEIEKCKSECFDILQRNERVQEFKEIYQKKF
jgi:hypothetical protein